MSNIYRVDKEKGITLAVWDGAVMEEKLQAHLRKLPADPDWAGKRRLPLSDLWTTCTWLNINAEESERVLQQLRAKDREGTATQGKT